MSCMSQLIVDRVAVGSQNPIKIRAVTDAIQQIWPDAMCTGCQVDSGVSAQPTNEDEAIRGAVNRAMCASRKLRTDWGVGLEGYTVDTAHGMFLAAWVAVVRREQPAADTALQIGLGSGGRILVPEFLAERIRHGGELGPLMDQVTSQLNTKHQQGAIGILTNGLVDRQEALRYGVLYALARFVSPIPFDDANNSTGTSP